MRCTITLLPWSLIGCFLFVPAEAMLPDDALRSRTVIQTRHPFSSEEESDDTSEEASDDKNLISDGGFENPDNGETPYRAYGRGKIGAWTIENGSVDIVGPYWRASEGDQSLDLSGMQENPGTISQEIHTTPMRQYRIRFSMAANPEPADIENTKKMKIYWGDQALKTFEVSGKGHDFLNVGWTTYEIKVYSNEPVMKLSFESLTNTPCGPILDDISVVELK